MCVRFCCSLLLHAPFKDLLRKHYNIVYEVQLATTFSNSVSGYSDCLGAVDRVVSKSRTVMLKIIHYNS